MGKEVSEVFPPCLYANLLYLSDTIYLPACNLAKILLKLNLSINFSHHKNFLTPVYKRSSVVIILSVSALIALFLYTLKWLSSSLLSKAKKIFGKNNPNFIWMQGNFLEKCNKTLSKIYKHLVQQKLPQKVHNTLDVFFIRHLVLTK